MDDFYVNVCVCVMFIFLKYVIMLREWNFSMTDKEATFPREMLNVKHTTLRHSRES